MMHASDSFTKSVRPILVAMSGTALLTVLLAVFNDIAEWSWSFTRSMEVWEIDELLFAVSASAIVGFMIALVQVFSLTRQVAQLEAARSDAQRKLAASSDQFENILRCTLCSKYQLGDAQWLSDADYIEQRCDATVVAGVCPKCRN